MQSHSSLQENHPVGCPEHRAAACAPGMLGAGAALQGLQQAAMEGCAHGDGQNQQQRRETSAAGPSTARWTHPPASRYRNCWFRGRSLSLTTPLPFLSSSAAASSILRAQRTSQKSSWLPGCAGVQRGALPGEQRADTHHIQAANLVVLNPAVRSRS